MSDDRGRVPFALVGVLLLVGSLVYANGFAVRGPADTDRAASRALDRADATARPAVRAAATAAARAATRNPVVTPADTPVGRALDPDQPFRDALRLRIYRRAAAGLASRSIRIGHTQVHTRLPPLNETSVRAAIDRVHVASVANDTALRVRVEHVTHVVERAGRVLARERGAITVTVAVPAIALHERTQRYERRLDRGPTAGPGLGQRLTGRLVPIAAARGLAQYGGTGIENVLATRHVELATNGARLALQRATFGRSDPAGRAAFRRASGRVGLTDVMAGSRPGNDPWVASVLTEGQTAAADQVTLGSLASRCSSRPAGTGDVTVGVNGTADAAAAATLDATDAILTATHSATVTRRVETRLVAREPRPAPAPPGPNWTAVAHTVRNRTTVTQPDTARNGTLDPARNGTGDATLAPGGAETLAPGGAETLAASRRRVVVTHIRRTVWTNGVQTRVVTARWQTTHAVRLTLVGRYDPAVAGPARPTRSPFDDVLAPAVERARDRLPIDGTTGDRLAARGVSWPDTRPDDSVTVRVEPSPATRRAVHRALFRLRERVRNVSVTVSSRAIAGGTANPPRLLADRVARCRTQLVAAPARYAGPHERARIAVRAAYLDRLRDLLGKRAETASDRNGRTRTTLADRLGAGFGASVRAGERVTRPERASARTGPAGPVTFVPDADPAYLTATSVDPGLIDGVDRRVTPLATRNVNVFGLPYGDAADGAIGDLLPTGERVSLQTAGRTAVATRRTLARARAANRSVPDLAARHERLTDAIDGTLAPLERHLQAGLQRRFDRLDSQTARSLVAQARAEYAGPGAVAVAATNGSFGRSVADVTADRLGLGPVARERLAVRLTVALRTRAGEATVSSEAVNGTVSARRRLLERGLAGELSDTTEKATDRLRKRLATRVGRQLPPLSGLPLAPVPGYWYATANVWLVTVRGEYPRFSVTARIDDGVPTARYVREAATVAFDADGDGVAERVGRNRPVTFQTSAVAFAVVPAGKTGVGDVTRDERSSAWACPDGPACNGTRPAVVSRQRRPAVNTAADWRHPPDEGVDSRQPATAFLVGRRPTDNGDNGFARSGTTARMLYDAVSADAETAEAVQSAYAQRLREAIGDDDRVAAETGVASSVIDRFAAGDLDEATLSDAAAVLGYAEGVDPETIEAETRDHLMLGMSNAILDVDTLAGEIDGDLTGQELQQALEGRTRLTLTELAGVHACINRRQP